MKPLLPATIDNSYRGHKVALWLFGLLLLMKLAMSMGCTFNGYRTLMTADGVPLDTYPRAAAQTMVALFAIFGFGNFVLGALCILVLVRYRSIIPFMFAVLLFEHLGRKLILSVIPIARVGDPPASLINYSLLALMIAGLGFSLWRRR